MTFRERATREVRRISLILGIWVSTPPKFTVSPQGGALRPMAPRLRGNYPQSNS